MNGIPPANRGSDQTPETAVAGEKLRSILRQSTRDSKVIFGAHRGVFALQRIDIENFFHLVTQRVAEQNGEGTEFCEVGVYYNDGTSRRFPSIESFNQYTETNKRHPTVVTLHIVFLISFPESREPEKQEIDILIRASESTAETVEMVMSDSRLRMSGDKIQMAVDKDTSDFGVITYTINHSRVTWGLDLESHIRGHIERLLEEPSKLDKFLAKMSGPLNIFTTVFVGLYCVNLIIDGFFRFLYRTDGAKTPEEVLQAAATYLVNGHIAKYIVAALVVSTIFFVIFSAFVSTLTRSMKKPRPSFICLDERDDTRKREKLRQYDKRWTKIAATIVLNISVGLLLIFLDDRISALFAA